MTKHFIAWWNVENLFDVNNAPPERRSSDIKRKIKADLKNWDANVLDKKTTNLARVIKQMNNQKGPDIMGVCEVENEYVLRQLLQKVDIPGRNYDIIHHDSSDNRGIDVAFIYDKDLYDYNKNEFFNHTIIKRYPTREIVQVTLKTKKGNELVLVGNHWPSRSAGTYESEPYRIIAAETLSYFIERIQEVKGDHASIVVMGDFNDEPFSRSLTDYALSVSSKGKILRGRSPYLYNLMWPLLGERIASYSYSSSPLMIDQFMVAKGILKKSGQFKLNGTDVKIEIYPGMETKYKTPIRFGQEKPNLNGYSDHFPISFTLTEKN